MTASRTVERIQDAETETDTWSASTLSTVVHHNPLPDRWQPRWWVITVAWAQKADESPEMAAQRLQQYVLAYRERNGAIPPRSAL